MPREFDDDLENESDFERRPVQKKSGKAIASLVLGLMSFFCAIITGLPAIIFGILGLMDISKSRGRLSGQGLAVSGIVTGVLGIVFIGPAILIALLVPAVQKVREAAARIQSQTNLKQIVLSMHNHHDTYGRFPLAYSVDAGGKPLLSWRVHLLPYLGEDALYKRFKLDEPWDSPTNRALISMMPKVYSNARQDSSEIQKGMTPYRVFVGPGTALDKSIDSPKQGPPLGAKLTETTDGFSNTLMIAEAVEAVEWTKPEGLPLDAPSLKALVFGPNSRQFNCAKVDATVASIPDSIDETTLRNFITRNDGQPVNLP
jgi:hypothetical protein